MFCRLGNFVSRYWPFLLLGWGAVFLALSDPVALMWGAPQWNDVVDDGEFKYLPETVPSRRGEKLFQEAFSNHMLRSTIVIVVQRENNDTGLQEEDWTFIKKSLKPRLERLNIIESALLEDIIGINFDSTSGKLASIENIIPDSPASEAGLKPNDRITKLNGRPVSVVDDFRSVLNLAGLDETLKLVVRRNSPGSAEALIDFEVRLPQEWWKSENGDRSAEEDASQSQRQNRQIINRIRSFEDPVIGELMVSDDDKATLVILELTTEFQEKRNKSLIKNIEKLIDSNGELGSATNLEDRIPLGLDLFLSGSATFGRDMKRAAKISADSIESWTLILVSVLLLLIYRSPVLMLVPLLTVYVSVFIAIHVLVFLADAELIQLFESAKIYVRVVMYGAGIDYCMFLMARYREELDGGATFDEAIASSIGKVGAAITASAGTVMCGIGMMVFAEFGKFQQAGICMSLSLVFVLCAALTFTPSLLKMMGRWAFWPQMRTERIAASSGWTSSTSLMVRLFETHWLRDVWKHVAASLLEKPGFIWIVSVGLMVPFAGIGIVFYNNLSYGLISELPNDQPSVIGTAAVQAHFPAGTTGPVRILIENPNVDFGVFPADVQTVEQAHFDREQADPSQKIRNAQFVSLQDAPTEEEEFSSDTTETTTTKNASPQHAVAGFEIIRYLTKWLEEHQDELNIADIRSVVNPLGITPAAKRAIEKLDKNIANEKNTLKRFRLQSQRLLYLKTTEKRANEFYVSDKGILKGHVTRIDVVFNEDPFSKDSIGHLDQLQEKIQKNVLHSELGQDNEMMVGSKLFFLGTTARIRDLKTITGSDQIRINILVIAGVFLILVILLRRPAISAYLIISVFFSYLVTLGVTFTVFKLLDWDDFSGLDWKVPMFLFTILIAVGEDYNIFLMTRIEEEQQKHGPIKGITVALQKTGGIISSCGLIMAGTFASLMSGSLDGMIQLGFALAFGVLLDTFVVRPILVPAYLILLNQGRLGALGKFLGAESRHSGADGK